MNPDSNRKRPFPIYLVLVIGFALIGITIRLLQSAGSVSAQSGDLQTAVSTYPNINGSRIDSCSLCHTSAPSLNPYGLAYRNGGRSASALRAIENQDSDGDGFTNLQEINALTFPGDSTNRPAAPSATNTPFQPATPTRTRTPTQVPPAATATNTRTSTQVPATATATNTRTSTSPAPSATAISTNTPTQVGVTAQPSSTARPSVTPPVSSTATVRPSRTPTVKPTTRRPTVVPTCVRPKVDSDKDDDDDDKSAKPNCSRKPTKEPRDSDDHGRKVRHGGERHEDDDDD